MRRLLIVLGLFFGLVIGITVLGLALIDPNDYRDDIAGAVEQQTGRDFELRGDIGWRLFPRLALDLGAFRLGSGDGFDDTPLIRADGLQLGMAVLPLLRGEFELDTARLQAPQVNLLRNAEGTANWQNLTGADTNEQTSDGSGNGAAGAPGWLAGLSLGGIELTDGQLRFDDAGADQHVEAEAISLSLGALRLGEATSFDASAQVDHNGKQWDTALAGELTVSADGRVALRGTELTANDLAIEGLDADLVPSESGWRLHPLTAEFSEGAYQGDVEIDTATTARPVRFDESLTGAQIGPVIAALSGIQRLTGEANLSATGQMALGADTSPLTTLNAETQFAIRDGAIRGINIARSIRRALARLEGESPAPEADTPSTDFTSLSGSATIRDGVARTEDIALDSPLLRVRGRGSSDLAAQTLDLALRVSIVDSLEGQGGAELDALKDVPIPLRITGSWTAPRISVDLAKAVQESQSEQLQERLNEEVDKLRDRVEGLFN
jgi:AsmA protein